MCLLNNKITKIFKKYFLVINEGDLKSIFMAINNNWAK